MTKEMAKQMELTIATAEDMEHLGEQLAAVLQAGDLVYLMGELGAGKTTLVRGIARGFGFQGRVNSPTFTIMNQYGCQPPITHLDFYRLESGDISDLGLDDYIHRDAVMLIEWPQAGYDALPSPGLKIEIKLIDDDYERERQVCITPAFDNETRMQERLREYVTIGY